MYIENNLTTNSQVIADIFSKHFNKIGSVLAMNINSDTDPLKYTTKNTCPFTIPSIITD